MYSIEICTALEPQLKPILELNVLSNTYSIEYVQHRNMYNSCCCIVADTLMPAAVQSVNKLCLLGSLRHIQGHLRFNTMGSVEDVAVSCTEACQHVSQPGLEEALHGLTQ